MRYSEIEPARRVSGKRECKECKEGEGMSG